MSRCVDGVCGRGQYFSAMKRLLRKDVSPKPYILGYCVGALWLVVEEMVR